MIKPLYSDIEKSEQDLLLGISRMKKLWATVMDGFPDHINVQYSVSGEIHMIARCWLYLEKDAPEEATTELVRFLSGKGFRGKREFRTGEGVFYWFMKRHLRDDDGGYGEWVLVENAATAGCVIKQKTVTRTEYYSECPGDIREQA